MWGTAAAGVLIVAAVVAWVAFGSRAQTVTLPTGATATASTSPTPTPTTAGYPENIETYDLSALPTVDVFAVVPALPVDADPTGVLSGVTARAAVDTVPVFADPTGAPVAALPRDSFFDGTTVAVTEQQDHWAHVLLTGRATAPSTGQLTGWVRAQDVTFATVTSTVDVDLTARTIDIVNADASRERVATDFGSGATETPTPTGRSFIMLVRADPTLEYTAGHAIVYLSEQSRTLAGFDGAEVAVTAFHYHDSRTGTVSNGCLRLDATAIDRLAQLPEGTPVYIH